MKCEELFSSEKLFFICATEATLGDFMHTRAQSPYSLQQREKEQKETKVMKRVKGEKLLIHRIFVKGAYIRETVC